jgi:hypothetical protein
MEEVMGGSENASGRRNGRDRSAVGRKRWAVGGSPDPTDEYLAYLNIKDWIGLTMKIVELPASGGSGRCSTYSL